MGRRARGPHPGRRAGRPGGAGPPPTRSGPRAAAAAAGHRADGRPAGRPQPGGGPACGRRPAPTPRPAGRAGRLPARPRGRPRRHGRRLRGPAALARPPGGAEGPARSPRRSTRGSCSGSSSRPRRRPACTTRTSCRSTRSAASAACHYYAMQFIEGRSLAELDPRAAAARGPDGGRPRDLRPGRRSCSPADWPERVRPGRLHAGDGRRPGTGRDSDPGRPTAERSRVAGRAPAARRRRRAPRSGSVDPRPGLLPHGGPPGHPGGRGAGARPPAGLSTATSSRPTS